MQNEDVTTKRIRRSKLITKSREAALAAVQIFNNPLMTFKTEIFIVLIMIAWTYLLHAFFRRKGIDLRCRDKHDRLIKENGRYKYFSLSECLGHEYSPIKGATKLNLEFLIGLRNEIIHHKSPSVDSFALPFLWACCVNYNKCISDFFGEKHRIDKHLSFALQFSFPMEDQYGNTSSPWVSSSIRNYLENFIKSVPVEERESPQFSCRIKLNRILTASKEKADLIMNFVAGEQAVDADTPGLIGMIKETEKPKYKPSEIVARMIAEGFKDFKIYEHTKLWKDMDARKQGNGYGVLVSGEWYWYDSWLSAVREYCKKAYNP